MTTRASVDDRRLRPRPTQSLVSRPSTAPDSEPTRPPHAQVNGTPEKDSPPQPGQRHQNFVLTDPVAFRYLEEDPATAVIDRRRELPGYECYVVEQWATSRSHPTFTITTYTGDTSHSVVVDVLSVPTDESAWSPRLRVYFKALNQYHAKRRETSLGILMVTNLSGFPSSLTVITVPDGDLRKHRFDFFVNENLKRLGCSGRVGLTLVPPTGATIAKFHQLYRTSDKNELYKSVIELVKLCQSALLLFDRLEIDYADGLLCDVTERAINDWWLEMGSQYYNIEPHDGILGPTTVAGLLGLLMGARNRLHAVNAPVSKDPFDVEAMKRGISAFQKQQRITRTRRLDRKTLERLHRATQKAANHDGWAVPKAVKSTVAELSGKGGEMVMDVVGRRDRAGIAEIETVDIERFVQLVYGERCKWLWYGKPLKKTRESFGGSAYEGFKIGMPGRALTFREGEHGGYTWTAKKSVSDGMEGLNNRATFDDLTSPVDQDREPDYEEDAGFRGVLKRTSGFKEAKSGLGRFKGAVGLGGHHHKGHKEEPPQSPRSPVDEPLRENRRRPLLQRAQSSPTSVASSPRSPMREFRFDRTLTAEKNIERIPEHDTPPYAASYQEAASRSQDSLPPPSYMSNDVLVDGAQKRAAVLDDQASESATMERSIAGSVEDDLETNGTLPNDPETEQNANQLLRRTVSQSRFVELTLQHSSDEIFPRHLSFSLAEESVLTWPEIVDSEGDPYFNDAKASLVDEDFFAQESKQLRLAIDELNASTAAFTQSQLCNLQSLIQKFNSDEQELGGMYGPLVEHWHSLHTASEGILRSEKERLEEGTKEVETLTAKLEYEINGLKGRVEEVEAAVGDFDKGVRRVEDRVAELEKDAERASKGWSCVMS